MPAKKEDPKKELVTSARNLVYCLENDHFEDAWEHVKAIQSGLFHQEIQKRVKVEQLMRQALEGGS